MSEISTQLWEVLARRHWPGVRSVCEERLRTAPEDAEALHALGAACWFEGDRNKAVECMSASVALRPDPIWQNNLGVVYLQLRRWTDAIQILRQSVRLNPDSADSTVHLATALSGAGQPIEAIDLLLRLLERDPVHRGALESLAWAYRASGREEDAYRTLSRAAEIHADAPGVRKQLTETCIALQRIEEAHTHAVSLSTMQPDGDAFARLALTAWETGRRAESVAARNTAHALGITDPTVHSALLLLSLYDDSECDASLHQSHILWALKHCPPLREALQFPNEPNPERKLRIGFVVAQLYRSAATPFVVPLLRSLDRARFDPFVYLLTGEDAHPSVKAIHRDLRGLSDEESVDLIRADKVDILIDCSGHQSFGRPRIFGFRPAPVMVVRSGYPATTGLTCMQALFADAVLIPEGAECDYAEPIIRNVAGAFLFDPPADAPPVASLPAIVNGLVTFGIFQKNAKLSEASLSLAANVLARVPGSRLLFHHENIAFDDPSSSLVKWIAGILAHCGIETNRLQFIGTRYGSDHLAAVGSVDIALDTLPYNGHATTCDCLWMGVPVVTMVGRTFAGRVGASLLAQTGLSELVASSGAEYVDIATSLSYDLMRLDDLRTTMRDRMRRSSLTDVQSSTRDFELECRKLWSAWCSRQTG